jgi:hypothetical protein
VWLALVVCFAAACDNAEPGGGNGAAASESFDPAGSGAATSAPPPEMTAATSPEATTNTAPSTAPPPSDAGLVHATVVATWAREDSSWLLVDLAAGQTIEGSTRVVVELDDPQVDCGGQRSPVFILSSAEEVSFQLVPSAVAERPADIRDLRWAVPVTVAGRDVRIECPSPDELTATIAAQRAKWSAAGVSDYEFTLRWGVFNATAGDYRVTVVDGRPAGVTRLNEPMVSPDGSPLDVSDVPATIEEVFDRVDAEVGADRIVVCYDSQLGYPVDVLVDQILNGIDDELTMAISELTIAGAATPSVGCTDRTKPSLGSMSCDVYLVGPDGAIGTTPVRSGVRGFSTVARAELPAAASAGQTLVVTVPSDSQLLISTTEQFNVVAQRDFLRVFAISGGSVVDGSVSQTPADNAPATADGSTVGLGLSTSVPGGQEVTFPAARFEVVAADTATTVEVSLLRYESTLDLQDTNGSIITIRATCAVDPNVLAIATIS